MIICDICGEDIKDSNPSRWMISVNNGDRVSVVTEMDVHLRCSSVLNKRIEELIDELRVQSSRDS